MLLRNQKKINKNLPWQKTSDCSKVLTVETPSFNVTRNFP